ncbi:GIY-YIG nuclease family protein [Apibacter sp. HY039]|uniref:GIY-YIG nuclease family protein n=1 Tax=Apibacter sp. HY039 TaxID=2501476 RepID=UPI000FEBB349|nr:GIY-YIG nuclease family protein [Apibacter sp. HY039]
MMREDLKKIVDELPNQPGVYYIYSLNDRLIYIGKSNNIKKRLAQHFTCTDRKSINLQTFACRVSYELTGSELIALLWESEQIKKYKPIYNRAQRNSIFYYGLYAETTAEGYVALVLKKINNSFQEVNSYPSLKHGREDLFRITEKYNLCQKINGLYKSKAQCFHYTIKECLGACISKEPVMEYNLRVEKYLSENSFPESTFLLQLTGRTTNEKGLVLIENGTYKGFGFCSKKTRKKLESFITPKTDTKDARRIIRSYLRNNSCI